MYNRLSTFIALKEQGRIDPVARKLIVHVHVWTREAFQSVKLKRRVFCQDRLSYLLKSWRIYFVSL